MMRFFNLAGQLTRHNIIVVSRLILGGVFLTSSIPKLNYPYDYLSIVYSYGLVRAELGSIFAMTLPWIELFMGICLLGGIFIGGALLCGNIIMILFLFAQATVLYRGLFVIFDVNLSVLTSDMHINYSSIILSILILLIGIVANVMFILQPSVDNTLASS